MDSLAAPRADAMSVTTAAANRPTISWAAVIAGMFVAVAVQIGLAELCIAAGFPLTTPFAPDPSPIYSPALAIVAGMAGAMVALFAGGWVAGRLAHYRSPTVAALHGALVWATGSVVAAALLASAIALLAGGVLGDGMASRAAASARTDERIPVPSAETVKRQVQEAIVRADAVPPPDGVARLGESSRLAERSRLMDLLDTAFPLDPNQQLGGLDREDLIVLLASQMRSNREVAERTFDQFQLSWKQAVGRYQDAREDATARAQRAAAIAARSAGRAATIGFAFMLIGAIAATFGGICGSAHHRRSGRPAGDDAKIVVHA